MSVLAFSIEGRASLVYAWEVAVALNLGVWVLGTPRVQDLTERVLLALRAIVKRIAPRINTANIGYVQRSRIITSHPIANLVICRKCDDFPICLDYFVIATRQPSEPFTPVALDALHRCRLWRGRAVDHKVFDLSHIVQLSSVQFHQPLHPVLFLAIVLSSS